MRRAHTHCRTVTDKVWPHNATPDFEPRLKEARSLYCEKCVHRILEHLSMGCVRPISLKEDRLNFEERK